MTTTPTAAPLAAGADPTTTPSTRSLGRRRVRRASSLATMGQRTFTGALALLFLFPMVWAAVSSVSPRGGTNHVMGAHSAVAVHTVKEISEHVISDGIVDRDAVVALHTYD